MQLAALQCGTPHHEIAAHGVADFPGDFREHDESQQLRTARDDTTREGPVADTAAFDVPASDGQVGATPDGPPQLGDCFGGMLQVGIHYGKNVAAGDLPSAQNSGGEVALVLAANGANLRKGLGELKRFFPSAIGTIVVDDNNFLTECGDIVQDGDELLDDGVDVDAFVVRGENQGEIQKIWRLLRKDQARGGYFQSTHLQLLFSTIWG